MTSKDTNVASTRRSIGFGAFSVGILVGTVMEAAVLVHDDIPRASPGSTIFRQLLPIAFWSCWFYNNLIVWLPFHVLRKMTPSGRLARLAFILLILAPGTLIVWLVVNKLIGDWIDVRSNRPPITNRLEEEVTNHWQLILFLDLWGGLACWATDQRSCLFSEDRSLRLPARVTLAAVIATAVFLTVLFLISMAVS